MERIGVIGLGRMGSAMARRLMGAGVDVTGWTRSGRGVDGVVKDNERFPPRGRKLRCVPSEALEHRSDGNRRNRSRTGWASWTSAAGLRRRIS
jgi:ketopantoate reductase